MIYLLDTNMLIFMVRGAEIDQTAQESGSAPGN